MSKLSKKRQSNKNNSRSKIPWKRNKKQPTLPQKTQLTTEELADYKRQMTKIVKYANMKIDQQLEPKYTDEGDVYYEMTTELHTFLDNNLNKRFDISQLTDPADIREYMTQVRVVLSSIDDGGRKAALDTAVMEAEVYRNQFGNQHRSTFIDEDGKVRVRHFNINPVFDESGNLIRHAIDPSIASKAFAAYRRLEEQFAGYIGRQGQELMFGSENLIILLYDYYEKNPESDRKFDEDHNTDEGLLFASPLLDEWIQEKVMELEGISNTFKNASSLITSWNNLLDRRYF